MKRKPPLQALVHAVGHPSRVHILAALDDGPVSASMLSDKLKSAVIKDVRYHLDVLEKQCGLVERVDSRPAQGGVEYLYGLSPISVRDLARDLASVSQCLGMEPFRTFLEALLAASADTWLVSEETTVAAAEFSVDEHGFDQARDTLLRAVEKIRSPAAVNGVETGVPAAVVGMVLLRSKIS